MLEALQRTQGNVTAAAKLIDLLEVHFTSGFINMVYSHGCVIFIGIIDYLYLTECMSIERGMAYENENY